MTATNKARHFFDQVLHSAVKSGASDVHLKNGVMPVIRKHGSLKPLSSEMPRLTPENILQICQAIMTEEQWQTLQTTKDCDLAYEIPEIGRFRINAFYESSSPRMVIRVISNVIPSLDDLNLPEVVKTMAAYERGLVLVTGVTGSGKSSTLASMINLINQTRSKHILTIEDPVEFQLKDKKSIITQRELGLDAKSFPRALRAALRQDPDVILIGEMRDQETIETAIAAAETGHLVFSTLHTLDAGETINRIITMFDQHQQQQMRHQLASTLKAIISQRLVPNAQGNGYVPAVEIMVNNTRTKELIIDPERTRELGLVIEESQHPWGMQSFDQSLLSLVHDQKITYEEALKHCTNPDDFKIRHQGIRQNDNAADWAQKRSDVKDDMERSWNKIDDIDLDLPPELKKASGDDFFTKAKKDVKISEEKTDMFGRKKKK